MAAHPDSSPTCSCKMHSWKGSVLKGYKVVYRCRVGLQNRQYAFDASSISRADAEVCRRLNDDTDTDYTVIPDRPVVGGGVGCLPEGTLIQLYNGKSKAIELLTEDDQLACGVFGSLEIIKRNVQGMYYSDDATIHEMKFSDGTTAYCSGDQYIMTAYGPVKAEHIYDGASVITSEKTLKFSGKNNIIIENKNKLENQPVVSIDLDGNFFFFSEPDRIAWSCGSIGGGGIVKN